MNSEKLLDICCKQFAGVGEVCIAGGAIRDELMTRTPKDWDVFVMKPADDFEAFKAEVMYSSSDLFETTTESEYSGRVVKKGILYGIEVQIIASPCCGVYELLKTFDWSVCLFAKSRAGGLVRGANIQDIYPGNFMDLQTVTNPLSTLRRGFRFCDRYKVLMKPQDITRLCSEVLSQTLTGEIRHDEVADLDVAF